MPQVTMRQMLEAGVHFGHQTRYWNPRMAPYIFGARGKIHIINLEKTAAAVQRRDELHLGPGPEARHHPVRRHQALGARDAARRGRRCGMPYVRSRWLGGMLTNFRTVKQSINRLKELEGMVEDGSIEKLRQARSAAAQARDGEARALLGGIKNMNSLPDALFVIDIGHEDIAVQEAQQARHPGDRAWSTPTTTPTRVDYVIPGNDDAIRAVQLYARAAADAVLEGKAAAPIIASQVKRRVRRDSTPTATRGRARRKTTAAANGRKPPHRRGRRSRPRPRAQAGRGGRAAARRPCQRAAKPARPAAPAGRVVRCTAMRRRDPLRRRASPRSRRSIEVYTMEITAAPGQGTARAFRRRHDGVQEGPDREPGRHRSRDRVAAQAGPGQGRQEGRPRRRRRPHRAGRRRQPTRCWSRSTPRPISSPRTRTSSPSATWSRSRRWPAASPTSTP